MNKYKYIKSICFYSTLLLLFMGIIFWVYTYGTKIHSIVDVEALVTNAHRHGDTVHISVVYIVDNIQYEEINIVYDKMVEVNDIVLLTIDKNNPSILISKKDLQLEGIIGGILIGFIAVMVYCILNNKED